MKVKDIMEPIKNWLTPEMSLREAVQVMRSTKSDRTARSWGWSTYEMCIMP